MPIFRNWTIISEWREYVLHILIYRLLLQFKNYTFLGVKNDFRWNGSILKRMIFPLLKYLVLFQAFYFQYLVTHNLNTDIFPHSIV